jgi:hypothetical protein
MSDYLWDKTGEAEEDVERLEELLGQLRFQPRTFEVPATLPVVVPRRAPRTLNNLSTLNKFSWSRLAIAASLLLTLLAGAWLIATKRRTSVAPPQMAQQDGQSVVTTPQPTQTTTAQPDKDRLASVASGDGATSGRKEQMQRGVVEQSNAASTMRHQRREIISVAVVKRHGALPRQLNVREVNAPRGEVATMTPREKEAMEKFMLAMKVTSEKLGYAERQVQGLNESSPQR